MTSLTKKQINWLNKCCDSTWTLNPKTGLVDVFSDFDCSDKGLTEFKGVKFGVVDGTFDCDKNRLTSLEGAPLKVGGDFYCSYNRLTSLEGAPQEVVLSFVCQNNHLTSLEGAPLKVGGSFYCGSNALTSLEGAPLKDGGSFFDCENNPVSEETLAKIYDKMKKGDSFMIAAGSLINKMGKKDRKLISKQLSKKGITEDKIEAIKSWCSIRKMI